VEGAAPAVKGGVDRGFKGIFVALWQSRREKEESRGGSARGGTG